MGRLDDLEDFRATMEAREVVERLADLGAVARAEITIFRQTVTFIHVAEETHGVEREALEELVGRTVSREYVLQAGGRGVGAFGLAGIPGMAASVLESRQRALEESWLARYGHEADFSAHCLRAAAAALAALNRVGALGYEALVVGSLGTPWFGWDSDIDLYISRPTAPAEMDQVRRVCRQLEDGFRFDLIFASQIVTEQFREWLKSMGRDAEQVRKWRAQWTPR